MSPQVPVVIYAAKSTEDRHGSIPRQLADCRAMAEREGWQVVAEFSDEGFSAYKRNRGPDFDRAKQRVVEEATSRGECVLVAQHTDRFARGAGDAPGAADHMGELYFWARRHNVRLRSVQDDSNLEDAIRAVLIGERNAEDSKRKSAATSNGKRERFNRGDSTGPVAFGYRLVNATDREGRPITAGDRIVRRWQPDPDEARVVTRMFEMLDAGYGIGDITRWVNGQGVRTKRGNTFGRSRVREILGNPVYGGKVRSHGETRDGNHEPLIAWDEFDRISSKLGREDRRRGGRPSDAALLSRVLRCADCGGGIWHRKGSGGRRRYVCGNVRHATGACDAASFDAVQVENAVLEHLGIIYLTHGAISCRVLLSGRLRSLFRPLSLAF